MCCRDRGCPDHRTLYPGCHRFQGHHNKGRLYSSGRFGTCVTAQATSALPGAKLSEASDGSEGASTGKQLLATRMQPPATGMQPPATGMQPPASQTDMQAGSSNSALGNCAREHTAAGSGDSANSPQLEPATSCEYFVNGCPSLPDAWRLHKCIRVCLCPCLSIRQALPGGCIVHGQQCCVSYQCLKPAPCNVHTRLVAPPGKGKGRTRG